MRPVIVGLGGNLGDVPAAFARAARAIALLPGVTVLARSGLWRTAPVGPDAAQPWFWNAALALDVATLSPTELLAALLTIEAREGRERGGARDRPRTLDLDLLLWSAARLDTAGPPHVRVPHPRLGDRAFALAPLVEVAGAGAWLPGQGPAGLLLARARAGGQRLERVRDLWPLDLGAGVA